MRCTHQQPSQDSPAEAAKTGCPPNTRDDRRIAKNRDDAVADISVMSGLSGRGAFDAPSLTVFKPCFQELEMLLVPAERLYAGESVPGESTSLLPPVHLQYKVVAE